MYVNNEIGVIQPIRNIGQIAKENSIAFFCDATQAIGKIKVDVEYDNIDMLAFSGHKIRGPKGIGVLYKRKSIKLTSLIHGGSQENGIRGGTQNTPLIVGIGKSCEIISNSFDLNKSVTLKIHKKVLIKLIALNCIIIGSSLYNVPNIICFYLPGIDALNFIANNNLFYVSNGSACNSHLTTSSHVLKALGINSENSNSSIRISIDEFFDLDEFDIFCDMLINFKCN
jgi:cysteine desulfurase